MKRHRTTFAALVGFAVVGSTSADAQSTCRNIPDAQRRLACFDSVSAAASAPSIMAAVRAGSTQGIPSAPPADSHAEAIEVKYDRFKDHTLATLRGVKLKATMLLEDIDMSLLYIMPGTTAKPPGIVSLTLTVVTRGSWQFLSCHSLSLLTDGRRVDIPAAKHTGTVGSGYVIERISVIVPIEAFLQIANSSKVEGQLCSNEFTIEGPKLMAVRDFSSRMKAQ